jgi:hypothetical protein
MGMNKESTQRLTQDLKSFSQRNRSATEFDPDDFCTTFEKISPFVTNVIIEYLDFLMFRSRAIERGTDFEHVKQMGYPPAHRVKTFGRCNMPGQSILYAASNQETSFLEIDFSDEKPCALIVQFKLKPNEKLRLLPIGELDHYRRHRRPRVNAPGAADNLQALLDPLEHYDRVTREFVDAYLADYLSRVPDEKNERNLYEVTAGIANAMLSQSDVDGLIFPSVRHHGGLNYAIKPEAFDSKFIVEKYVLTTELYNHGYGLFEYFAYAEGAQLNDAGQFVWHSNYRYGNARMTWPLSAEQ